MSDKTYVLSLSANTFNAFKMDFDSPSSACFRRWTGSRATAPPSTAKSA